MPTFTKIHLKGWKQHENAWYIKIENAEELLNHAKNFIPSFQKTEAKKLLTLSPYHGGDEVTNAIWLTAELHNLNKFSALELLTNKLYKGRLQSLHENKIVFIGENGIGWFPIDKDSNDYKVLEEIKKDDYIFPARKLLISYSKWKGGKHWYVKINGVEVKDKDDNLKWNNKWQAEEVVNQFLKENKLEDIEIEVKVNE
jgi:hypothetical protein